MILKRLIQALFGRIVTMALQVTNLIITNRLLGASGRGEYASATTWALGFFTFLFLSINIIYLKKIADNSLDKNELKDGFFTLLCIMALITIIVSLLAYFILSTSFFKLPFVLYFINILVVPFMMIQALTISVFTSQNDFKQLNIASIVNWLVNLILVIVFSFKIKFNAEVLSWITLASWMACGFYCLKACKFSISFITLKKLSHLQFWKDLSYLHFNSIMTYLVFNLNILLIHKYINNEVTGQYFNASTILSYLFIIPSSIQSVLMGSLLEKDDKGKVLLTCTFFKGTLLLMIIFTLGLFLLSKQVVYVIGGVTFLNSSIFIDALIPAALFQVAGLVWSSLWNIKGYFKIITKVSVAIVGLSVLLNFILIKKLGVTGAILTTTITSFLSMAVHLLLAYKEFKKLKLSFGAMLPNKADYYLLKNTISPLFGKIK